MKPLYQIKGTLYQLFEELEHTEDVELQSALLNTIESCQEEFENKLENICAYIKNLNAESDMLASEMHRLKVRREKIERSLAWLSDYLKANVSDTWESADKIHRVGFRRTEKVDLADGAKIEDVPPQYLRENLSYEIDKINAKKDMKCGATVPGLTLKSDRSVVIK